jgi:ZIP family zinc transporter
MLEAMLFAGATFFSTMSGGIVAIRWPSRVELLMALAGGVVLGAAVFDLLPEAIDQAGDSGVPGAVPWIALVLGYAAFRLAESRLHDHGEEHGDHPAHGDAQEHPPGPMGIAGAIGFVTHSFFDGLAIGLGFQLDAGVGVLVALAVIGHDFSDGLNTVSYLVAHRHSEGRQWRWLFADALAPVVGALVASLLPVPDEVFPVALGFFSGVFVYAASAILLPRALAAAPARVVPLAAVGAALMFAISRYA